MLIRKIERHIEDHLSSGSDKIMIIEGARQIGKSYIIREVGKRLYKNFIEINFVKDSEGDAIFKDIHTTSDFYLILSSYAGKSLGSRSDTLVFIDEIQEYPQFLTMLKFLREEKRFTYIASGSMLGLTLKSSISVPVGSVIRKEMFQLDFEEFLMANGWGDEAITAVRDCYQKKESLSVALHENLLNLFKRYLLVGGMPDAVNEYLTSHNIIKVREIQDAIMTLYKDDASKYEHDNLNQLKIRRIYEMIPSQMENKKKRIVAKDIQGKKGERFDNYVEEFEYLISSGISLGVNAVTNPRYPLSESARKNLVKLYLNDVGMLTSILYGANLQPILRDDRSINLGAVYESVVAQELRAHGHKLYYYDNRQRGEVDFLVDSHEYVSVLPIEVKSGRDYTIHSALDRLITEPEYHIKKGIVLSNDREVRIEGDVLYMPIYYAMFIGAITPTDIYF